MHAKCESSLIAIYKYEQIFTVVAEHRTGMLNSWHSLVPITFPKPCV